MNLMRALYGEMAWPVHEIPSIPFSGLSAVSKKILNPEIRWTQFYQFAEFIPTLYEIHADRVTALTERRPHFEQGRRNLNGVLEQAGSPYRMVIDELAPITNQEEVSEVRNAFSAPAPFELAGEHIAEALAHLGRRPEPNYHDCVKQAFSAVESVLWVAIGGKPKIPEALRQFQEKYVPIHAALRQTIEKLHGYASDEEGGRHAATERTEVGEPEARLMLVTCSAVTNFLIRKAMKF